MNSTSRAPGSFRLRTAVVLAGAFVLGACASVPPAPTAGLQAAQRAIATAEAAEAGRYAPGELAEARTELASADTAVSDQRMTLAARLADESRVEAELASARTGQLKAKAVNDEMTRSTSTLIEEMQRGSGAKP
jgi:hypothetical protein